MTAWAAEMQRDPFHFERLWLSLIANKRGNLRRLLVLPKTVDNWKFTRSTSWAGPEIDKRNPG